MRSLSPQLITLVLLFAALWPRSALSEQVLSIDHVMFPVYNNTALLTQIEPLWQAWEQGRVERREPNNLFSGIYYHSRDWYVEYLSNVPSQPYWSNAVYVVVPKQYWDFYATPAWRSEHFLIPEFGSGFQLVSPDYPYLNSRINSEETYRGFTLLISPALAKALKNVAGQRWQLPANVQVDQRLKHRHDMGVINEHKKLIAPLLQANPVLRDYL